MRRGRCQPRRHQPAACRRSGTRRRSPASPRYRMLDDQETSRDACDGRPARSASKMVGGAARWRPRRCVRQDHVGGSRRTRPRHTSPPRGRSRRPLRPFPRIQRPAGVATIFPAYRRAGPTAKAAEARPQRSIARAHRPSWVRHRIRILTRNNWGTTYPMSV